MSYLEQSTRYIAYDSRLGGRYRYFRDPEILSSPLGTRYIADMDRLFENYAEMVTLMTNHFRSQTPKSDSDSDFVYRQATAAKAFDAVRGMLPAASLSNVGIYASGQAYEALLIRMRSHPLPEARSYAELMMAELRKVVPSFLKRVDLPDRGEATGSYMLDVRDRMTDMVEDLFPSEEPTDQSPLVDLTDFDPDAEVKLVSAAMYSFSNRSDRAIEARARAMTVDERLAVLKAFVGDRANRRHRPGRALERPAYRFDVMSDYGAFRDLQRHRMMTIDWQRLCTDHGFVRPPEVDDAGLSDRFDSSMERSAALHDAMRPAFPDQAPYAAALAYRVRYMMHMNAREAMHVLELRTSPRGTPHTVPSVRRCTA